MRCVGFYIKYRNEKFIRLQNVLCHDLIVSEEGKMDTFFKKYQFWFKCWGVVWCILSVVFSLYIFSFFLGNHDWQFLRYEMLLSSGVWEGRVTQFVPPWLLSLGRLLPIWNALLGFMFLSGAAVLLAWWYGLAEKSLPVVLFSLLVVLHPYVCSQLYYVHTFISIGCWHFLTVLGCMAAWQFAENHKISYFIGSLLCLWSALVGYAACIELIIILMLFKLLFLLLCECVGRQRLYQWLRFSMVLIIAVLCYAYSIWFLQKAHIVNSMMYNTQSLGLSDIIRKFFINLAMPFRVLSDDFPYADASMVCYYLFLVLIFNIFLWQTLDKKKCLAVGFIELAVLYGAFILAYVSPFNFFYIFRIHSYSVPYLVALMFAFVILFAQRLYKNLALLVAVCLVCCYVACDISVQKVWFLGNSQDDRAVERIKSHLLPKMVKDKHYRLSTLGNFYGRKKFACMTFVAADKAERYREYWGAPYFITTFFSSGLFAYETSNPIWGDSIYMPNGFVFYATNNEILLGTQKIEAQLFAQHFKGDKSYFATQIRQLHPYPKEPYMLVEDKDIVLMLSDTAHKDVLIRNILEN